MGDHVVFIVEVGECDTLIEGKEEREEVIQMKECRICQEEDTVQNLDMPCACSGTLKVFFIKSFLIYIVFFFGLLLSINCC